MVRRRRFGAVVGMCVVVLAAGCGRLVDGTAVSVFADPFHVGGLPAVNGYSGLRPDAPPPVVVAEGGDDGAIDEIARQSITDIETFWGEAYGQTFTGSFRQVDALMSWDATTPSDDEFCGVPGYRFANAAFCPADHIIGWDRGVLLPAVRDSYGDMGITVLLAHEYGHAVASMARLSQQRTPALMSEQQADCFAGAYLRWVAQGNSPRFALTTDRGLDDALAVMIAIRDPLLTDGDQHRGGEHGSAFERVSALQAGFTEGVAACAAINIRQIEAERAALPTQLRRGQTGEWPISEGSVRAITDEMTVLFRPAERPRVQFDAAAAAACPDARPSPPVSYCPDANSITVDLPALQTMSAPPRWPGDAASSTGGMSFTGFQSYLRSALSLAGDNTGYSVLISRYMLALQHQRGLTLDSAWAGLRTACLTGAATAAMAAAYAAPDGNTVGLTAGDLDEAVTGLLTNGLVASDVNGVSLPAGFSRIEAFHSGVVATSDRCAQRYP